LGNRTIVEVRADLHRELRKLAADYDTHIYVVASLLLEDCLSNPERVTAVLAKLASSS
jgi:hypothetical protein